MSYIECTWREQQRLEMEKKYDVKKFDRALTAVEVREMYEKGVSSRREVAHGN